MKQRDNKDSNIRSERGHNLLEYGLVIATITLTAIVALQASGAKVCNNISKISNAVMRGQQSAPNLDPCTPFTTINGKN
jgi:Flp pilus assembly pilin Flp